MIYSDVSLRLLQLYAINGVGPKRIERVLHQCPLNELASVDDRVLEQAGLNARQRDAYHYGCHGLTRALNWLDQSPSHVLMTLADEDYPARLREINSPPPVLFINGQPSELTRPQIAIVGSRQPSFTAQRQATRFADELAQAGLVVTSGLALGIDACAHRGALRRGQTIAVMGTGPDQIYPARHRDLAEQIVERGALVSEFLPGTAPKAQQFPRRNRVISGLSIGLIVAEAACKSGSLISAHYAVEQNRELFAIPGNIDNPLTAGPHQLIQHGAKLITKIADILEEITPIVPEILDKAAQHADNVTQQQLPSGGLLDNVGYETTSIDQIVERSLLPVEQVVGKLIELELAGLIAAVPGGYVRLRRNP